MVGISIFLSPRIVLYLFFACGVVLTTRCSSDLTDSLEGRACGEKRACLTGYECNTENICVPKRDSDSENGDAEVDSGLDSKAKSDAEHDFDSRVDTGADSGRDSVSESGADRGFDGSVDASAESSIPKDGGDTGSQTDAGFDAGLCGYEIKSTETDCPIECDSCSDGVCLINCDLEQECSDTKITCPDGLACNVVCSNKHACKGARIDCPSTYNCTVSCTAEQSCMSAWMRCGNDGPCALNCESGAQTCQDAVLECKNQACKASCGSEQIPPKVNKCPLSCTSRCGC